MYLKKNLQKYALALGLLSTVDKTDSKHDSN